MLEKAMTEFGYAIIQTLVTDISPDEKVKRAMAAPNATAATREHGQALLKQLSEAASCCIS